MLSDTKVFIMSLLETRKGLLFIFFLSAILKGTIFFLNSNSAVNHDALTYIAAGQAIASGNWSNALLVHPLALYPALIAAIHAVGPDWVTAARLLSYFSILLTLIPLYFLAEDLFGARTAFWAVMTFTLSPEPLHSCFMVIREPLYTFLLILFVFLAQRAIFTEKFLYLWWAAIAISFSVLCRPEGIIVFLIVVCFLVWRAIANPDHRRHCLKVALGCMVVTAMLVSLTWLTSTRGFSLIGKHNQYADIYMKDILQANIFSNYERVKQRLSEMERMSHYEIAGDNFASISGRLIPLIYMVGVIAGIVKTISLSNLAALLVGMWRFRASAVHGLILFLAVAYTGMIYLFVIYMDFFDPRFIFFPATLLYPWIAFGVSQTIAYFSKGRHGKALAAVAVLFFCITPLYKSNHLFKSPENVLLQAGEWLSNKPELKKGRLAATDDRILFYAFDQTTSYRNKIACRQIFTVDFACLGEAISRERIDALFVYDDIEKPSAPEAFNGYRKSTEFTSGKKVVFVFQPE
jgi:Dolichyl-phosphate-mannose-protein mannosyltransferase